MSTSLCVVYLNCSNRKWRFGYIEAITIEMASSVHAHEARSEGAHRKKTQTKKHACG